MNKANLAQGRGPQFLLFPPPGADPMFPNCSLRAPGDPVTDMFSYSRSGLVGRGRTVSRVLYPLRDGDHLSATPVARRLQRPIPEGSASRRQRPPIWSCSERGLPGRPVTRPPVGSYPTISPLPGAALRRSMRRGGVISVALSFGSPRLGVTQRPALWSPDFPPTRYSLVGGHPSASTRVKSTHGCSKACVWYGRPGSGRL
jgi:hypothetical protein